MKEDTAKPEGVKNTDGTFADAGIQQLSAMLLESSLEHTCAAMKALNVFFLGAPRWRAFGKEN